MSNAVKYEQFNLSITKNGESLIDSNCQFVKLELVYAANDIPRVQITFKGTGFSNLILANDIELEIVLNSGKKHNLTIFVSEFLFGNDDNTFTLVGYNCKSDFINTHYTSYLGSSLTDAISKVKGDFDDSDISDINVQGEFYQISESNYKCLLRLLSGLSSDKFWSIDELGIHVNKKSEATDLSIGQIITYKCLGILDQPDITIYDNDVTTQGWFRDINVEHNSEDWVNNYLSYLKNTEEFDSYLTLRYPLEQNLVPGTLIKLDNAKDMFKSEYWTVVNKVLIFTPTSYYTDVMLGANCN